MTGVFHGAIPADLRSIIYEHAAGWPDTDLYVGCSGNFTIERTLHARPGERRPIHGNDVTAYSSALGWWLAGQPLDFRLKEEHRDVLGWLEPYLGSPTDLLHGTVLLRTGRDPLHLPLPSLLDVIYAWWTEGATEKETAKFSQQLLTHRPALR